MVVMGQFVVGAVHARIILESDVDVRTDQLIRDGLCICFPEDTSVYSKTRAWNGYDPAINAVIERRGKVIAHAAAIDKNIIVGSRNLRVAGIMNVYVLFRYRKRGLAGRVVDAALHEAALQGYDLGLLFCKAWLETVYAKLGWKKITDRAITRVVEGRELPMREHIVSMYYPIRLEELPPGDIHLQGNEW